MQYIYTHTYTHTYAQKYSEQIRELQLSLEGVTQERDSANEWSANVQSELDQAKVTIKELTDKLGERQNEL
jgi:peptidoglycan hydrolase CwlO-like protein